MANNVLIESGSLQEECVRLCPSCAAEVVLKEGTVDGEIIECPDCAFELEVVFDPSKVDLKTIAADKGFDISWIDLSVVPTLVPAPVTKEDYGE